MKKHYSTHVEDTDKLISVAGPRLEYEQWYEDYVKLMEEQAQRKYGIYTPTSEIDEEEVIEPIYPYSVYTNPSVEFSNLLASEDWSSNEEEYDI